MISLAVLGNKGIEIGMRGASTPYRLTGMRVLQEKMEV
jgi:hypothetical protein